MSPTTIKPTRQQLEELDAMLQRMLALPVGGQEAAPAAPPPPAPAAPPSPPSGLGPATYTFSNMSVPSRMTYAAPAPAMTPEPAPPPQVRAPDPVWTVPLPGVPSGPSVLSWSQGLEVLSKPKPAPTPALAAPAPAAPVPARPSAPPISHVPAPPPVAPALEEFAHGQTIRIDPISTTEAQASAMAASLPRPLAAPRALPIPVSHWPLAAIDWICGSFLASFGPVGRWFGKGSGKILFGWVGLLMIGVAIAWAVMDYFGWSW